MCWELRAIDAIVLRPSFLPRIGIWQKTWEYEPHRCHLLMAIQSWTTWQCSWYANLFLPPNAPVTSVSCLFSLSLGVWQRGIIIVPGHSIPMMTMWRNASMGRRTACHVDCCTYMWLLWLLTCDFCFLFGSWILTDHWDFVSTVNLQGNTASDTFFTNRSHIAVTDFCGCTEDVH